MTNKTCPVCGLEQAEAATECGRCRWDFSPMLGTAEQTRAFLAKRLEEARAAWRQRRYNPELVPELERDPFETPEEFAARIAERPWYVGEAELQKDGYDIKTGRFPLRIKSVTTWAEPWVSTTDACHLELPRERARALYQEGVVWPVYARLGVRSGQLSLDALMVPISDGGIPVVCIPLPRLRYVLKIEPPRNDREPLAKPALSTGQDKKSSNHDGLGVNQETHQQSKKEQIPASIAGSTNRLIGLHGLSIDWKRLCSIFSRAHFNFSMILVFQLVLLYVFALFIDFYTHYYLFLLLCFVYSIMDKGFTYRIDENRFRTLVCALNSLLVLVDVLLIAFPWAVIIIGVMS